MTIVSSLLVPATHGGKGGAAAAKGQALPGLGKAGTLDFAALFGGKLPADPKAKIAPGKADPAAARPDAKDEDKLQKDEMPEASRDAKPGDKPGEKPAEKRDTPKDPEQDPSIFLASLPAPAQVPVQAVRQPEIQPRGTAKANEKPADKRTETVGSAPAPRAADAPPVPAATDRLPAQPEAAHANAPASLPLPSVHPLQGLEAPAPAAAAQLPPQVASVSTPVGQPAWNHEIATQVSWLATQRVQSAELRVQPPELGPVHVSIRMDANEASVVLAAPHADTRQALETAIPVLRDMLETRGIALSNASIGDGQGGAAAEYRQPQNAFSFQKDFKGKSEEGVATPSPRTLSLVDVFA